MATYYVDPTKTIAEINNSTFAPGDFILFARGGTWRDTTLTPRNSGEPGKQITYGFYGSGAKPQVLGSNLVSGVEVPTRGSCISHGNKSYITIQGLELAYPTQLGIDLHSTAVSNWIVDGAEIHHCGLFNAPTAAGISSRASHCRFINGRVYECGSHGININADPGATVIDVMVDRWEFFNNYHADCQVLDWGGGAISQITFSNNLSYTTAAFAHPEVTSCCGFYVEGINPVDGVQMIYNVVINHWGNGFALGDGAKNVNIFNNTAYKSNPLSAINSSGFHVYSGAISGINIKNNIGVDWKVGCLKIQDKSKVASCDNNLWYHSGGGANAYVLIDGVAYHYNDFAAYKTTTGFDAHGKWENPKFVSLT